MNDEPNYVAVYLRVVIDADDYNDAEREVLRQLENFPGEVYVEGRSPAQEKG